MTEVTADEGQELAEMQARWKGWRLWRSGGGSWCATRRGRRLSDEEISGGLANTLMEPTREALAEQLQEQHRIGWGV